MKFSRLLMIFVFTACGQMDQNGEFDKAVTKKDPRPDPFIDPAIQPYYDQFFVLAKGNGINVVSNTQIIQFVDHIDEMAPDAEVIGYCESYSWVDTDIFGDFKEYPQKSISILRSAWDIAGPCFREGIVIHEAGHCDLGLDHSKNPESLMYPTLHVQEGSTCLDLRLRVRVMFDEVRGIDPNK